MKLCKTAEAEYVIQIVEATTFYTYFRFSLLTSTWFPRPVAVFLWSVLHIILAVYVPLMLLGLFITGLLIVISLDVFAVFMMLYMVAAFPVMALTMVVGFGLIVTVVWVWLVITCQCCTLPVRAPGQSVARYIITAGGTIGAPQDQAPAQPPAQDQAPAAAEGGGGAAGIAHPWAFLKETLRSAFTVQFIKHVGFVSFPYWRIKVRDLCQEIVPLYDAIVI